MSSLVPKTVDERKQLLAQTVRMAIARGGAVQSQSDFEAVILYGKPVNHILHLILCLCTCGIWWLVWIVLGLSGGEKREMIIVDEWGNVAVQRLPK